MSVHNSTWIVHLGPVPTEGTERSLGGKGRQLAELTALGYPVPRGFVVTAEAFRAFCDEHRDLAASWFHGPPPSVFADPVELERYAATLRASFERAPLPDSLGPALLDGFDCLRVPLVAVRSSASEEDGVRRSYAGQFDSYLNVDRQALPEAVRRCWASLLTARSFAYRDYATDPGLHNLAFAVVVQEMVQAEVSGVCFTRHPVTGETDRLYLDAVWGLGEALVSGEVQPDTYVIHKRSRAVVDRSIGGQDRMRVVDGNSGVRWADVPRAMMSREKLTARMLTELSSLAIDLERVQGYPCDIEWAIAGMRLYALQCRPITR